MGNSESKPYIAAVEIAGMFIEAGATVVLVAGVQVLLAIALIVSVVGVEVVVVLV